MKFRLNEAQKRYASAIAAAGVATLGLGAYVSFVAVNPSANKGPAPIPEYHGGGGFKAIPEGKSATGLTGGALIGGTAPAGGNTRTPPMAASAADAPCPADMRITADGNSHIYYRCQTNTKSSGGNTNISISQSTDQRASGGGSVSNSTSSSLNVRSGR